MADYAVHFTNLSASPIIVQDGEMDVSSTDVSLFGRIRLEYGEFLNESLLHLLENYACPEDSINIGTPDLSKSHNDLLSSPVTGQFWYNSTTLILYQWNGTYWIPIRGLEDVAANWGTIAHGQFLPRPISPTSGYEFPYEECIWSVSPAFYQTEFSSVRCGTSADAQVVMQYRIPATSNTFDGMVNYLIIGIRGNFNLGTPVEPPPLGLVTPTPTPVPVTSPLPAPSPQVSSPEVSSPPVSSPPAIPALNSRLYISPSTCDPGVPGPGGGTNTEILDTCGGTTTVSAFNQSLYVSLQSISGGVPPYTVNFSNLYPVIGAGSEPGTLELSYLGGTGTSSSPIRTGVSAGEIAYARIKYVKSGSFNPCIETTANFKVSGYVILTDSLGTTKRWWVPDSSTSYPTAGYVAGCPIGGTNLTGDTTPVPGSTLWWAVDWSHIPSCGGSSLPGQCGVRFYSNDPNHFKSEQGLIDVNYTGFTIVCSFYGDSYIPGINDETGSVFDAGNTANGHNLFEFGYGMRDPGDTGAAWEVWMQRTGGSRLTFRTALIVPSPVPIGRWNSLMFSFNPVTSVPDGNGGLTAGSSAYLSVNGNVVQQRFWDPPIEGFRAMKPSLMGMNTETLTGIGGPNARLSYVWAHNAYYSSSNYSKFFTTDHKPKYIGENGELAVGVQPKSYFPNGDPTNNRGTLGNWVELGEVERVPGPNG